MFSFSNCRNEKGEKKERMSTKRTELSKKGNKEKLKIRKEGRKRNAPV